MPHRLNYRESVDRNPDQRVLVVGDAHYASLAAVRGLRAGGYEPWLASPIKESYAARSRATAGTVIVPPPADGAAAYVEALAADARRLHVAVVLPCNELSLKTLAGRAAFDRDIPVASNPPEVVERATNKAVLRTLAADVGLRAPPTVELTRDELEDRRAELSFPAILKPASSVVVEPGRATLAPVTRPVATFDELARALAQDDIRWLIQPLLQATLAAVSGVAWRGELVCSVHQAALRIYPPLVGVSAYAQTVAPDPRLERLLTELLARIGWSGIFEFQLLRAADGDYLIDLNPRPYGSLSLAIGAGLNLPAIWTDLALGRAPAVGAYRPGVRYRAETREGRALLASLARGQLRQGLEIVRPRRRTIHALFSLRDPAPLLLLIENAFRELRRRSVRAE